MRDLFIDILTWQDITAAKFARELFVALRDIAPDLVPERYGNCEPLKGKFEVTNIDEVITTAWRDPLIFKRSALAEEGIINISAQKWRPSSVKLAFDSKGRNALDDVVNLFYAWVKILKPEFAFMHLLTNDDIQNFEGSGTLIPLNTKATDFTMLVTIHELKKYIPNLYWATAFGEKYHSLFGSGKIRTAPAPVIRELSDSITCMQLSKNPLDMKTDPAKVNGVRRAVKDHLGASAFFSSKNDPSFEYTAPAFA